MKKALPKRGERLLWWIRFVNSDFTTGGADMQAKPLATQNKRTSEIAEAVQAGKADILSLWAAVERFAWQQTLRWVRAMEGRAGVE